MLRLGLYTDTVCRLTDQSLVSHRQTKITNVEVGPIKESRVAVPKVHTYLDEPKMAWPYKKDGS